MNLVDPTGEIAPIIVGIGLGLLADYVLNVVEDRACKCGTDFLDNETIISGGLGGTQGLLGPYKRKHRVGVAGGGPSGNRTSQFSEWISKLRKKEVLTKRQAFKLRKAGRLLGKTSGVLSVGFFAYRVNKIRRCL